MQIWSCRQILIDARLTLQCPLVHASEGTTPVTLDEVKQAVLGEWVSIAPEVRPSAAKNPDGTLKPFYLSREFNALPNDEFELTIVSFADPYGKAPLARIYIKVT